VISQAELKEALSYNPTTGVFIWISQVHGSHMSPGSVAGSLARDGYVYIQVQSRLYKAHRLAILYTDGYMPENTVDHIDRVRDHNWRSNLREATIQCQNRNCGMRRDNTSGVKGVRRFRPGMRWTATIAVNGRNKHLGYFDTLLEAACHRYAAEQCLGWDKWDGNSSAKQFIDKIR